MQNNNESKSKNHIHLGELISKISLLKIKLVTCGYSVKEVTNIIFTQFLSLPEIDWSDLQQTKCFYQAKSKYKVSSNSAEIILRLQKSVPNLHTLEVCQYLLTILQLKAAQLGFNIGQLSSDSNDSGSGIHRLMQKNIKRRIKNPRKKQVQRQQKYKKQENQKDKSEKRVHFDLNYLQGKKKQQQLDIQFKNIQRRIMFTLQDVQIQKQFKNMPQNQQNQHQKD